MRQRATSKWPVVLIGVLGASAPGSLPAQGVDLRPLVSNDLTGNLHIQQDLPLTCDSVNQTTAVTQGRLEIAPGEDAIVVGGQRLFMLTHARLSFAPLTVERHCVGQDVVRHYTEVNVQLAGAVSIQANPIGPLVYSVVIPKENVLLHEASLVDGQAEGGDKHPKEDIVGTLNLGAGTVALTVKVATKIHVKALCVPIAGCAIDGDYHGTLTATLSGTLIFPDTDGDGIPNRRDNCRLVPNPDQQPVDSPIIRAPGDLTLPSCIYRSLGMPTAADLCEGGGLTIFNNAPPRFPVGTTVVTWTARDIHLRTATDTQNVTVVDTTRPSFLTVPPGLTLNNCVPTLLGAPTGFDDCDLSLAFTNNAPGVFPPGTTVVTWTARDDANNEATATQTVTVVDTVLPTATCSPVLFWPGYFRVSASDACTASPTVRLGSFVLEVGETIRLVPSTVPGVRFVGYDARRRRQFEVGPNANVIVARDAAGNVRTAKCSPPIQLP